ncbi:unnamed protein product [Oreochromis niloticus]|nr:unnamed protein product [Mustela putorius furo]
MQRVGGNEAGDPLWWLLKEAAERGTRSDVAKTKQQEVTATLMSATMRLPTLLILFFQAVQCLQTTAVAKSPQEISGYLGENVTLPAGVNPSWRLTEIEWSIFTNITLIATYRNDKVNTERVPQYKGRLSLSKTSGDLTIHNLKESDATEYTVEVRNSESEDKIHQIKLTAKQKLQQPTIQIVTSTSVESGCLMVVNCSSLDKGVNLSWSVEPVSVLTINKSNPSDSSAQLFAFVNTKENFASFTCISSRDTESVSSKPVTPKCDSKICVSNCTTPPSPTTGTQSCAGNIVIFVIIVLGICGIISYMIYRYRVKSYSLQGDLSLITQNAVALVQRRQGVQRKTENAGEALQNQEDQVAAQRPREEEQKRNQNEDSNEKAIQHKEENRELEQEQEEQASRMSQQPQQEFLNDFKNMPEDRLKTTVVFE